MNRFDGAVVVVTGGARGIGQATAARFASEGARVASLDIASSDNTAAAAQIVSSGGQAMAIDCDVRSNADQASAFESVIAEWGQVDVLVASAGIYRGGPLPDVPIDRWRDVEATNLTGVLISNQLAAPLIAAGGKGSIINVSSMAAKTSWPNSAEYSATKSGVVGITRSAAMEFGRAGVTVNAVCPGNTSTDMLRGVAAEVGASVGMSAEEWLAMRASDTAIGRLAEPWEIAGVIAFLASEDARYITGQAIEVDGGLVLD